MAKWEAPGTFHIQRLARAREQEAKRKAKGKLGEPILKLTKILNQELNYPEKEGRQLVKNSIKRLSDSLEVKDIEKS